MTRPVSSGCTLARTMKPPADASSTSISTASGCPTMGWTIARRSEERRVGKECGYRGPQEGPKHKEPIVLHADEKRSQQVPDVVAEYHETEDLHKPARG